jgi:hypothetical protein
VRVKQLLLAVTLLTGAGGLLDAATVIDCAGSTAVISSCVATKLANFTTQLDWAVFGPAEGTIHHNAMWTANNLLMSGLDVSVSDRGTSADPSEGLRLAYNLGTVFYDFQWTNASTIPAAGYVRPTHFNSSSNPNGTLADILADRNLDGTVRDGTIHLLGLALNGLGANREMVLDFSSGMVNFGFYATSAVAANFDLRVQVFAGAGGTGTMLSDNSFSYTGVGATCGTMLSQPFQPTGCNDAPFVYGSGFGSAFNGTARSLVVSSSDPSGFYMTNLFMYDGSAEATPEPGPMVLCGLGIVLLAIGNRKRLRRSSEQ